MSETLTPVFRLEYFIVAAANGTPCDLEPVFNEEKYLHAIAGASVDLPMPVGRTQEYLAKLAGMDVEIPDKPIYRTEYYLAHMIDSTVECPAPVFREEMFYYEWASNEYVTVTGNPVSFTALAAPLRQLSVAFSPVQDLNGYDSPWPAGGGKNKCPTPVEDNVVYKNGGYLFTITFNNGVMTWTITGVGSTYYMLKAFTIGQEHVGKTYTMSFSASPSIGMSATESCLRLWDSATQTRSSLASRTATITADMVGKDLCISFYNSGEGTFVISNCQLEEGSSATSYAPYENLCPISGWDGVTVELTGTNIWSPTDSTDGYYGTNGTFNPATANGEVTSDYIPLPSGVAKLTIGYNDLEAGETGWVGICSFDENKQWISRWGTTTNQNIATTGVPVANAKYIRVIARTHGHGRDGLMLAFGQSVPYVPYDSNSRTISISFGSTVYSGWVDVVTGVVTVTMISQDMGTLGWAYGQATKCFTVASGVGGLSPFANGLGAIAGCMAFCSQYKRLLDGRGSSFSVNDKCFSFNKNANGGAINGNFQAGVLVVKDSDYDNKDTFKAAMSGVQLVYELATPLTIQLTPQEVESLAGDNVLFSDANGDLTVTYRSN